MSFVGGWLGGIQSEGGGTPSPPLPPPPVPVPVVHGDEGYIGYAAWALERLCEQFKGDPEDLAFPEYDSPEPPVAFPYVSTEGGSGTEESPYLVFGLTVGFTDASTSPTTIVSWLWDFGDGDVSSEQNPEHEYESGGVFEVTLTVVNAAGGSDTGVCFVGVTEP